jgi:hypothetical protein
MLGDEAIAGIRVGHRGVGVDWRYPIASNSSKPPEERDL